MDLKQAVIASAQGTAAAYSLCRYPSRTPILTCMVEEFSEPAEASAEDILNHLGKALVIDVRDFADYESGHIPTAIHTPVDRLHELESLFSRYEKIYVYSEDANCPASTIAAKKIIEMGYCNVYDFRGSFDE